MLVLTRRPGEAIIIGNDVKLTVVSLGLGRVKIGIEAPTHVRIDREEIHARIQQEQASDVLNAVSSGKVAAEVGTTLGSEPNTIVASGAETSVLHNRIADRLPANAPAASTNPTPAPVPTAKLSKHRLPRKPR